MNKVIFVKYNSLRRPDFRIVTEMISNCKSGKRIIRKRALCSLADKHLSKMIDNASKMTDYYNSSVKIASCRRVKGAVEFDCLEGLALIDKIKRVSGDKDEFIRIVTQFLDKMLDVNKKYRQPFVVTKQFKNVFGDVKPSCKHALILTNLDSTFDNFIIEGDNIYCIDYEWIFDFPIPVDYIKFRALYYLSHDLGQLLKDQPDACTFLSWFGFSKNEFRIYQKMEDSFQQFVYGTNLHFNYLPRYEKRSYHLNDLHARCALVDQLEKQTSKTLQSLEKQNQINAELIDKNSQLRNELVRKDELINTLAEILENHHRALRDPVFAISFLIKKIRRKIMHE